MVVTEQSKVASVPSFRVYTTVLVMVLVLPNFNNLSVLPEISRGVLIADLVAILGSIDIVLGEVDR